jgi:multiple sugar transport system substrate-binding protein
MGRRFVRPLAIAASTLLLVAACTGAPAASPTATATQAAIPASPTATPLSFQGVTVRAVTFTGPQIAEPLQRRAPDFEKLTGAKVEVVTVPFADLYQKILTDFSTKTNSYDAIVFAPQWMGDYVPAGYLEDLTERVKADRALQWDDIAPYFRDFSATYQGKVYTIPLDGDFQMVYYRSDILATDGVKPPETWEDYRAIAQRYQGKDLNGDGRPDYGTCVAMKRSAQSYWMFVSVAGAYIQSQGTSQGAFFNTDNMQPLFGPNEATAAALDVYKSISTLGPPDQLNLDVGDTRGLFTSGRCALSIDWGDIGTLAIDPATSKVQDKVGSIILPGSRRVLDRKTGRLVSCDATICPHATNGVNHAPFSAFGGWSGAVNKAKPDNVKNAAYAFLSYMSAPPQSSVDVTLGKTGFNPYRTSHFSNLDLWVRAGMSQNAAKDYLGAIQASLQSPNMVLDVRTPQNAFYEGTALDAALAQFLAGEISRDAAAKQIADQWNAKTDELGRDKQLAAYKATLGVTR